mgnify:CR=1 FL=1
MEIEKSTLDQRIEDLNDELSNAASRIAELETRLSKDSSGDGNKDLMALERRNSELESFLKAASDAKNEAERELQKYKSQVSYSVKTKQLEKQYY